MIFKKSKSNEERQRRFANDFDAQKDTANLKNAEDADVKEIKSKEDMNIKNKKDDVLNPAEKIETPKRVRRFHKDSINEIAADEETETSNANSRSVRRQDGEYKGRRLSDEYKYNQEREKMHKYHEKRRKFFLGGFIVIAACMLVTGGYFAITRINLPEKISMPWADREKETLVDTSMDSVAQDSVKMTLVYNGIESNIHTDVATVRELLEEEEIQLNENIHVSANLEDELYDAMELVVSEKIDVKVIKGDVTQSVTVHHTTVLEALKAAGIEYSDEDIVEPSIDTMVSSGMKISYKDVVVEEIKVVETIPFEVEESETNTVNAGLYAITQEGEDGTAQITYEVKYVDGVEESREEIAREVVTEPVNMIKLWGTAKPVKKDDGDSDSSSGDSGDSGGSGDDSDYDDIDISNPGQQETNPSVPASPSSYIEIMSGHVTAYTHTGSGTATGTQPRSTRTLSNPGTCAVVPSTIPYGSLLYVTGYGYCIAEDTGGFRHDPDRWNQIDVFMNTKDECYIWGRRRDVKVYILRKGY